MAAEGACDAEEEYVEGVEGSAKAPQAPQPPKAPPPPKAPQPPKARKAPQPPKPAPPPPLEIRSPVEGLPAALTASQQVLDGLRVGATVTLRAHISRCGTRLKNGSPPAISPLPRAVPASVTLTRTGVAPLLRRAAAAARRCGATQVADATERVLAALSDPAHAAAAQADGVSALFDVTGHQPLARLLAKHGMSTVPGEVTLTSAGIRITFPSVRFTRRLERRGEHNTPGRLFNWNPRGNAWLHAAPARGHNGAGLRTLSRNWKDWVCAVPGPYAPDGIPEGWQLEWDGARAVFADPGLLLCLCLADGRALSKAQWYELRNTWADFVPKPKAVVRAEAAMARQGGQARHPGTLGFMRYVGAFHAAQPVLCGYYGSRSRAAAREHKQDRLRSLLDQVLRELAPNPQVMLPAWLCGVGVVSSSHALCAPSLPLSAPAARTLFAWGGTSAGSSVRGRGPPGARPSCRCVYPACGSVIVECRDHFSRRPGCPTV